MKNYNNTRKNQQLIAAFKEQDYIFYDHRSKDSGIMSKYPILEQTDLFPSKNEHGSITKVVINIYGVEV